nr:hypothetical protein [Tanacetum cinerariifolium]
MEQPNLTFAKILILDTGKFKQRKFRIQQYLQNEHYTLWEVIEFGDSYEAPQEESGTGSSSESSAKKNGRTVAITTEDMQKRRNDVKARTTLLLALLDEHQLRFSKYKIAQELWGAILKTFGGNEATKKTKKNQLKQQYGNFKAKGSETLKQTFNRLQAIVSHLKFMDVEIEQDDLNQKFLTSLTPEWLMYTIVWRNKAKNSNGKREVNTASILTASIHVSPTSADVAATSISHDITKKKITIQSTDVAGLTSPRWSASIATRWVILLGSAGQPGAKTGVEEKSTNKYRSNTSDLQNSNSSVSEHGESSESIMSKPMIKFFKAADSPTIIKTNKVETVRKPSIKYAEMYRNTSKSPEVRGNQRNWNNLKTQQLGKDFVMKNKACFKCGQFDHLAYDCGVWVNKGKTWPKNNYTHKSMSPRTVFHKTGRTPINRPNINVAQPKRTSFAKTTHSYVRRPFQRKSAVRTQFRAPRVSTVNTKFPTVDSKFPTAKSTFTAGLGNKGKVVKALACWILRPKQHTTDKGLNSNSVLVIFKKYQYIDTQGRLNGCSRHMTGNISYLSNYEPYDGGYVSFGQGGGKITGKDLTCLVAKASADESMLWHRRLGHLNFKIMNKLVRHNLVKGLPSKCFENDHTCVACLKGKHHKAYCKTKLVNSVSKPFHTLHMDLFGPTSVSSLNHKWYCLVVTDDFSRVSVNKSQNKTPYELFNSRTPAIGFLKPFGCHVMILNTLDHLGKFDAKGDEDFLENKLIEKGAGPNWLIDIETLTNSMNYVPVVVARTSSTNFSSTKDAASQDVKKDVSSLRYIALPNWFHEAHLESSTSNTQDACNVDAPESSGNSNPTATSKNPPADQMETLTVESAIPTVSSPVPTPCLDDSSEPSKPKKIFDALKDPSWVEAMQEELLQFKIQNVWILVDCPKGMDVKSDFLYSTIDEEVYVMQPPGFQDPEFLDRVYKVENAMYGLHQAPRAWYGTLSKYLLAHDFQRVDQTLFIRKHRGDFLLVQVSANTPMDKENPWGKDGPGKYVDLHLYRSMIGSLMYLTASRPDIMFSICAYARHQVTPKECHLHAVKRIFRYLKGYPKLGLWYPKESPFDLLAYSDSDYGGATQDRKSTTGGCQFLERRLISWQ